jgi:deoxyribonuclease V
MLVCLDVDYGTDRARAACLGFAAWIDAEAAFERVLASAVASAPYVPGALYLRELPHLLAALDQVTEVVDAIVVDGQAWLGDGKPGLGARLYEARGGREPVIGVGKTAYRDSGATPVLRGTSARPLYVSAAGMDAATAAAHIRAMHGAHRIPTLLKRVDRLARGASPRSRRSP